MLAKATFIALSAAFVALPASAGQHDGVTFRYQADELDTARSAVKLYDRLEKRAERACITPGARSLEVRRFEAECVEQLTDEFVSQIGHSRISDLHTESDESIRIALD